MRQVIRPRQSDIEILTEHAKAQAAARKRATKRLIAAHRAEFDRYCKEEGVR
jgi:cupin superfamily acireductone dioxygenase involved in methionine salvage